MFKEQIGEEIDMRGNNENTHAPEDINKIETIK